MTSIDLRSTEDIDPYQYYETLREQGPVTWDEGMNGWLVASYDECKWILCHEELFRHPYADADDTLIKVKGGRRNITVVLGDEHAAIRRFILQVFSPQNVKIYADKHIVPIAQALIDEFKGKGQAELVSAFCEQLPCRVLMSLFGMKKASVEEVEHIMALHKTIMTWAGGRYFLGEEATQEALKVSAEINGILLPIIRDRKQNPGDDVISKFWQEAPLLLPDASEDDILANCRELFLGGSDTTVQALSNGLYLLMTNPDVMAAVDKDRGKTLDNFIEEVIRLLPSVHYRYRIANADTEIGGIRVKKDQVLFTLNAAANRDPSHYGCPAQVDLHRPRAKDHLGFNAGPRTCVGVGLARMEMRVALSMLLDNLPVLHLDAAAKAPVLKGFFQRFYQPLNVLFERSPK